VLMGMAIRTGCPLELNLPSLLWKPLVGDEVSPAGTSPPCRAWQGERNTAGGYTLVPPPHHPLPPAQQRGSSFLVVCARTCTASFALPPVAPSDVECLHESHKKFVASVRELVTDPGMTPESWKRVVATTNLRFVTTGFDGAELELFPGGRAVHVPWTSRMEYVAPGITLSPIWPPHFVTSRVMNVWL
jgi:hypothetical protein